MLKCLFATCLTALSVNTQALPVSCSIEPSRAITGETTFNTGDIVMLSVVCELSTSGSTNSLQLFSNEDNRINQLKIISFSFGIPFNLITDGGYPYIDFCEYVYSLNYHNHYDHYTIITADDFDDYSSTFDIVVPESISSFTYSFTFEILEGFEGFDTDSLPYLTKVEKPYTPPSKSNLYRLLYDFYYSIFNDDDLTAISTGYNMPFDNWLAHTCTIATLITLIVVAFFFLRWLFKVISGLILLKR